jgi:nucleotide-binding universal stress UspA family protein
MKILIAIDGSECSLLCLDSVKERYWPIETEFRIITVVDPATYIQTSFGTTCVEPMLQVQLEYEKWCRQLVNEKLLELKSVFPNSSVTADVLLGPVAGTIIDEGKEWNADLIVVGSHGRTGVQKFFLGSVAERVASHAPCSIEIVKHKIDAQKSDASHEIKSESINVQP